MYKRQLLPKNLLAYAGLEKEALVVGTGKRAEIWNPAEFEADIDVMTAEEEESGLMELGF